jgi:hypothetical protein
MNPFGLFSVADISAAINVIPNRYGRLNELNLFPGKGVINNTVIIEEKNGSLSLLTADEFGSPGQVGKIGKRKVRTFAVPHFYQNERVTPYDVNGLRAFGSEMQAAVQQYLTERMETMRAKHDQTLEFMRMGALKGLVTDGGGNTIVDLYTEFSIVKKSVDFVLGTSTTDIRGKCYEVIRHIEDNLQGEVMGGVRALVSQEFFDKFIQHSKVKEAYANYQEAANRLGGDVRKGFTFGGITFEEYRASVGGTRFITADYGQAFPQGTMQTFQTFFAPADFNESVGSLGQQYYGKVVEEELGRGYIIHSQSHPLPLCMRPAVSVEVKTSN